MGLDLPAYSDGKGTTPNPRFALPPFARRSSWFRNRHVAKTIYCCQVVFAALKWLLSIVAHAASPPEFWQGVRLPASS